MNQIFTPDQNEIFKESIDVYGFDAQLDQVQEEALELALAIRKYKRASEKKVYVRPDELEKRKKELISEIADVIIMTQQCRHLFSDEEIQSEIYFKLNRQRARIDERLDESQKDLIALNKLTSSNNL